MENWLRNEIKSDVGDRIRLLRRNKNLSQPQLSLLTGISQPTICDYESGTKLCKYERLVKLSEALETKPEDISPDVVADFLYRQRTRRKYSRKEV